MTKCKKYPNLKAKYPKMSRKAKVEVRWGSKSKIYEVDINSTFHFGNEILEDVINNGEIIARECLCTETIVGLYDMHRRKYDCLICNGKLPEYKIVDGLVVVTHLFRKYRWARRVIEREKQVIAAYALRYTEFCKINATSRRLNKRVSQQFKELVRWKNERKSSTTTN